MAPSRNRGKKKPKLRDYSHLALTPEEKDAVSAVAHSVEQNPIATAILGAVLVEHELDGLLRPKFKKIDDDEWRDLQSEQGPLRSFSAKITIGFALGIYNNKIKADLDIVRVVRNAFAHSRKLLDFDDPLIIRELIAAHLLPAAFKKILQKPTSRNGKAAFMVICLKIQTTLLKIGSRAFRAKAKRLRQKVAESPFTNALLGLPYGTPLGSPFGLLHSADPKLTPQSSRVGQSDDPSPSTPKGFLDGLLPFLDDKQK